MEEVVRQIETYHKWSMGCLMGTVFCVIAAFILYKKLNIREVIRFFKRHTKRMTMFALIGISMVCWFFGTSRRGRKSRARRK